MNFLIASSLLQIDREVTDCFDIAIVGAGMAGASLAARVALGANVVIIEAEDRPGYHATGRSAAFWTESYGGPLVQPLTSASGPMLREGGFLLERGALTIGRSGREAQIAAFAQRYAALGVRIEELGREELEAHIPGLRPEWSAGVLEPDCCDIDVAALHQHYLGEAGTDGAQLYCRARVVSINAEGKGWRLRLADGRELRCGVLVNAAGAWADQIAALAGLAAVGIAPLRRTVVQLHVDPPVHAALPLVLDIDEGFYFKPESGRIWLSPHDETPSPPCDAAPEEIDVASAIDRLEGVVDWRVRRVEHRWAGLRSFTRDRLPVFGFDPVAPKFFWCAGQGGFGIQTAPASADLAARLLLGKPAGEVDPAPYGIGRFRS